MTFDPELARRAARADLIERVLKVLGWAVILLTLGLVAWTLISIRNTQIEGTPTGRAILRASDRIESCTTPGGECYERSQSATAGAIQSINEITIYAVTCSQQNRGASVDVVQKCVTDLYKLNHPKAD